MTEIIDLALVVLRTSTPLVFAALGVLLAERSGVMHIGVEGVMLLGAFAGALAAVKAGPWTGVVVAVAVGAAAGLLLAVLTVMLPTDQVVLGLAFNTACIGITSFLFRLTATEMQRLTPPLALPLPVVVRDGPGVSAVLSIPPLAWLAAALAVTTWWFLSRTGPGLIVRSVGHSSEAAVAAGIDVRAVRMAVLVVAGAVSGLAGAALTVGWVRSFADNISVSTLFAGDPPVPRSGSVMAGPFSPQGFCSIVLAFSRIQSISSGS